MIWNRLARLLAKPAIANWLIRRAMKTPYLHLPTNDNPSYMARYWVFNPYDRVTNKPRWFFCPWSIRIHHIKREDFDHELHDHPWNARTIILKGWYTEKRLIDPSTPWVSDMINQIKAEALPINDNFQAIEVKIRRPGDTAKLGFGEYHTITDVDPDGAWTLFISGPWRGVWGFLVNGVKVPWREYLGIPPKGDLDDAAPKFANGGYVGEMPGQLLAEMQLPPVDVGLHISDEKNAFELNPGQGNVTVVNVGDAHVAGTPPQYSTARHVQQLFDPVTGIPRCSTCKGYGAYQDGDSGTDDDGRAPNIVECDCDDSERMAQYRRANKLRICPEYKATQEQER